MVSRVIDFINIVTISIGLPAPTYYLFACPSTPSTLDSRTCFSGAFVPYIPCVTIRLELSICFSHPPCFVLRLFWCDRSGALVVHEILNIQLGFWLVCVTGHMTWSKPCLLGPGYVLDLIIAWLDKEPRLKLVELWGSALGCIIYISPPASSVGLQHGASAMAGSKTTHYACTFWILIFVKYCQDWVYSQKDTCCM